VNEDWMTELEPRAGEELERHLDRFARLRLDPSPGQAKRARSALMEAAWRQKLAGPTAQAAQGREDLDSHGFAPSVSAGLTVLPAPGPAASAGDRPLFRGWGARRVGASFAAAILAGLLVGGSVFAGSRPGGPLYEARLGLEELALPANAQARVEAELALAQGRLADIVDSVARDDQRAIAAAVAAYVATLDELGESTGGPADRALAAIRAHQAVLERVLGQVPEQARSGIQNALTQSGRVIDRLDAAATPGPAAGGGTGSSGGGNATGGSGTAGGSNPNAGGGADNGTGGSNPNAGGARNPTTGPGANNGDGGKPAPTAKPQPTAKPDPTAKPARTPKPASTPAPAATDRPTPKTPQGRTP
jgi:hypothetical protein